MKCRCGARAEFQGKDGWLCAACANKLADKTEVAIFNLKPGSYKDRLVQQWIKEDARRAEERQRKQAVLERGAHAQRLGEVGRRRQRELNIGRDLIQQDPALEFQTARLAELVRERLGYSKGKIRNLRRTLTVLRRR